jgi:hypothetical protein
VGVGRIFEMYRSGQLEDDDEVAVAHATAEQGHRKLSEAMVNVRATTAEAVRQEVITSDDRKVLDAVAKSLPYPDRSYPSVIRATRAAGAIAEGTLGDFERWLKEGRVDQKEADALELLRRLRDDALDSPYRPAFDFPWTDSWEALWLDILNRKSDASSGERADVGLLTEELYLRGEFGGVWDGVLLRAAALMLAAQSRVKLDSKAIEAVIEEFRRERGLVEGEAFRSWLRDQRLSEEEQADYFMREATFRAVLPMLERHLSDNLSDHLRTSGQYAPLVADANERRRAWHRQGLDATSAAMARVDEGAIWTRFFSRQGREVPSDISTYSRAAHVDVSRLRTLALMELLSHEFQQRSSGG